MRRPRFTTLALGYILIGLTTHQPVQTMVRARCPHDTLNALRYVAIWPVAFAAVYNVTIYHAEQTCHPAQEH